MNFIGEGALDYGGPRREFFRLFCHELRSSQYFHGSSSCFFASFIQGIQVYTCIYNYARTRKLFFIKEKGLLHYRSVYVNVNNPGFPIFADVVFKYLVTGKTTNLEIPTKELPSDLEHFVQQVLVMLYIHQLSQFIL